MNVQTVDTYPKADEVTAQGDIALIEAISREYDPVTMEEIGRSYWSHIVCPTAELAVKCAKECNGRVIDRAEKGRHLVLIILRTRTVAGMLTDAGLVEV